MTPNDIEVLLHYHVSQSVHPRINAPAVTQAIRKWVSEGILIRDMETKFTEIYRTSHRGSVLVKMLCDTPMSIEVYNLY